MRNSSISAFDCHIYRQIILFFGCIFIWNTSFGQVSAGGEPISVNNSQLRSAYVPTIQMPSFDLSKVLAEDEKEQKIGELPPRFGFKMKRHIQLGKDGIWELLPNGDRLWRINISSQGAYSINLLFDQFYIPEGASLFLYNEDRSYTIGSFTSINNKTDGQFATAPVRGDQITLEYLEPASARGLSKIRISHVVHAYKNLFQSVEDKLQRLFGDSGNCNNDVACPVSAGWEDQISSVALIIVNGSRNCSGALVNNTAKDGTPYFLSANHCGTNINNTWVFVFNYQSPTCGGADGDLSESVTGATLISNYSNSDFTLAELSLPPPSNIYYSGWDKRDQAANGSTGIHHPSGDVKKISFNTDILYSGAWGQGSTNVPGGNHWIVDDWEDGTTEGGSSGSPLYSPDQLIVGQLHGGGASCSNITYDSYGKVSTSWDGNGSSNSRLSDWLDPLSTNQDTLHGIYFEPVSLDISAHDILDLPDNSCDGEVTPRFSIKNLGLNAIQSFDLHYSYDNGNFTTVNLNNLNVSSNQSYDYILPTNVQSSGAHSLKIYVDNPNGMPDLNPENDTIIRPFSIIDGEVITVEILADNYPGETSFDILDDVGNLLYNIPSISSGLNTFDFCVAGPCFEFKIYDSYGDGICCGFGEGGYSIKDSSGATLASGGEFDFEESIPLCLFCPSGNQVFVRESAGGTSSGKSWDDAFTTLESAIELINTAACPNITDIWLNAGTYFPTNTLDQTATIVIPDGISLYGGFSGIETLLSERDPLANLTVISGNIGDANEANDNSYHVLTYQLTATPAMVLDGVTIKSGQATGAGIDQDKGGGVLINGGSPTINSVIFDDNDGLMGSCLYVKSGNPSLENCVFNQKTGSTATLIATEGSVTLDLRGVVQVKK